jgi:hypothetical protein
MPPSSVATSAEESACPSNSRWHLLQQLRHWPRKFGFVDFDECHLIFFFLARQND